MAKTININFAKHNKFFIFACFSIACIVCLFQSNNAISQTVFAPNTYKDSVFVLDNNNIQQDTSNESFFKFFGSHSIRLTKGFKYKAKTTDKFQGYVNHFFVAPCTYLTELERTQLEAGNINRALPVGSTSGISNVTPTGGFTYAVPIFTPSGTNGMQPKISLIYNSQDNNGIMGWGWGMSGLSMITRAGFNKFKDQKLEQFSNDITKDKLAIDGNRFVLLDDVNQTWGQNGAVYGTEVGNTQRITQHNNTDGTTYFIVENKDGSIIEYGNTVDSRVDVKYRQETSNNCYQDKICTVGWKINKIRDRFGNFITFTYDFITDSQSWYTGESVIKSIRYTGHQTSSGVIDLQPYYEVSFDYSYRSDRNTLYLAINNTNNFNSRNINRNACLKQILLLDKIEVKYIGPGAPQQNILRSYQLRYTDNKERYLYESNRFYGKRYKRTIETTGYSQLVSITESGENGATLNPLVFTYEKITPRNSIVQRKDVNSFYRGEKTLFGDFNGDGVQDKIAMNTYSLPTGEKRASWNLLLGQYAETAGGEYSFQIPDYGIDFSAGMFETVYFKEDGSQLYFDKSVVADFNSDGYDDLAVIYYQKNRTISGYNGSFNVYNIDFYYAQKISKEEPGNPQIKHEGIGFLPYPQRNVTFTANQNLEANPLEYDVKSGIFNPDKCNLFPMDYNADGKMDIGLSWVPDNVVDGKNNPLSSPLCLTPILGYDPENSEKHLFDHLYPVIFKDGTAKLFPLNLDVNNKTDLAIIEAQPNEYNSNTFFFELENYGIGNFTVNLKNAYDIIDNSKLELLEKNWTHELGDLNGDGLVDIVYNKGNREIYYRLGTGNGFTGEKRINVSAPIPSNAPFCLLDLNGDGKKDILIPYKEILYSNVVPQTERYVYACLFSISANKFEEQYFTSTDPLLNPERFTSTFYNDKYIYNKNIDFTGDGNSDIYCFGANREECILTFNNENNPLHLKSVIDGFGNKIEVKYEAIANQHLSTGGVGKIYEAGDEELPPLRTIKSGIYVTSSVTNYSYLPFDLVDKYKQLTTFNYSYSHATAHVDKGFLGFKEFAKSTLLEYESGTAKLEDVLSFKVADQTNYGFFPSSKITKKNDEITTEENWEYGFLPVNAGKSYFYYPKTSMSQDYLLQTSSNKVSIVDEWENLVKDSVSYFQDGSFIAYAKAENQYANKLGWCSSFLENKKSFSHNEPNTGVYEREVEYLYFNVSKGFAIQKVTYDPHKTGKSSTEYNYDKYGNLIYTKNSQTQYNTSDLPDRETVREYTLDGRFLLNKHNGSYVTSYEYYPITGLLKMSTDLNAKSTSFEYDDFGREKKVTAQTGYDASLNPVYAVAATSLNWITSLNIFYPEEATFFKDVTATNSAATRVYFTSNGRDIRAEADAFNRQDKLVVDKEYSLDGRLLTQYDPYFTTEPQPDKNVKYYYDEKLRLYKVCKNNNRCTTTQFGGNNPREITVTDPAGKKVRKVYDALGNIVESSDIDNTSNNPTNKVKYTYGNNFSLTKTTSKAIDEEDGFVTTNEYDEYGNLIKFTDNDLGEFDYTYNPFGELMSERIKTEDDGSGGHNYYYKYYNYDYLGRALNTSVKKIDNNKNVLSTEEQTSYTYYPAGVPGAGQINVMNYTISSPSAFQQNITFTYNKFGAVINRAEQINGTNTFTNAYFYNSIGKLSKQIYPSGVETEYDYDNATGLLYKLRRVNGGNNETLWEMKKLNEEGVSTDFEMGCGGIKTQKVFDIDNYPVSIRTTNMNNDVLQDMQFNFNKDKGVCNFRNDLANLQVERFEYDDLYRLTKATSTNNNINPVTERVASTSYYDDGSIKNNEDIGEYRYKTYDVATSQYKLEQPYHAVKATSKMPTLPDPNTPILQKSEFNSHRMISVLEDNKDRATFTYGYDNSRLKVTFEKFENGNWGPDYTKYYLGSYEKYVYSSYSKEITYINTPNGLTAAIVKTGSVEKTYYVQKDYLGSILGLSEVTYSTPPTTPPTPQAVVIVARFSFDAWGNPRHFDDWTSKYNSDVDVTGFDILERGFTGHEHIRQFNIINMNARLYDPKIGKFFSPDNYIADPENPQGYNRYSYAYNNPLKYTDPSGNKGYIVYGEQFDGSTDGYGTDVTGTIQSNYDAWCAAAADGSMEDFIFGYSIGLAAIAHQKSEGGGGGTKEIIGDILNGILANPDGAKFWESLNEATKNSILNALTAYCKDIIEKMKDGVMYEVWGTVYQYETVDADNNPILAQGVEFHIGKNNSPDDVWNKGEVTTDGNEITEPIWKAHTTFICKDFKDANPSKGALELARFHFHPPDFAVIDGAKGKRFDTRMNAAFSKDAYLPISGGKPSSIDYQSAYDNRAARVIRYIFCSPRSGKYDNYWYWNEDGSKKTGGLPWPK